jgi:phosphomevalonate kinase
LIFKPSGKLLLLQKFSLPHFFYSAIFFGKTGKKIGAPTDWRQAIVCSAVRIKDEDQVSWIFISFQEIEVEASF